MITYPKFRVESPPRFTFLKRDWVPRNDGNKIKKNLPSIIVAHLRPMLVLFIALFLSVSFTVPTDDIQETAYDEPESLPCNCTSVVSFAPPRCMGKVRGDGSGTCQHIPSSIESFELRRSGLAAVSRRIGALFISLDQSFRC